MDFFSFIRPPCRQGPSEIKSIVKSKLAYTDDDISEDDLAIIDYVGKIVAIRAAILPSTCECYNNIIVHCDKNNKKCLFFFLQCSLTSLIILTSRRRLSQSTAHSTSIILVFIRTWSIVSRHFHLVRALISFLLKMEVVKVPVWRLLLSPPLPTIITNFNEACVCHHYRSQLTSCNFVLCQCRSTVLFYRLH